MDDPAKFWLGEIRAYDGRQRRAKWNMWARHAVDRYRLAGTHGGATSPEEDGQEARYNIFWSNVENLKPGMYAQTPRPVVSRRHNDDDPVARIAADVIERVLGYQLSEHGFGAAIRAARDDYLLVGRGVPWVRYVPHIVATKGPPDAAALDGHDGDAAAPVKEMLDFEELIVDYVHWSDFGHTDARRWEEVRGVWRRLRLERDVCKQRFGEDWAVKLAYDAASIRSESGEEAKPDQNADQNELATIYEVWDARTRTILFVQEGQSEPIKVISDDPLGLPRFFPCSRPIYATLANEDLFPTSDYRQYRTQIRQIQSLTKRIDALTEAVKVVGAYDSSVPELKDIFKQPDNTLVPVTNWAALAGKGGLDGTISIIPMQEIAETLRLLHDERDKALNDSYQLTGISDLIRGDTQASETATAQTIKNNYITMRFDEKKREVDRCVVNTLDIMGSILCRQFADETIVKMSGLRLFPTQAAKAQFQAMQSQPPQPGQPPMPKPPRAMIDALDHPTWEEVFALLRDEPERRFAITIETDSTVAADQQQQQQQAAAFLTAVGGYIKQAMDAAQQSPQLVPLLGKMLEWGVRQFPIGRDLEDAISEAVDKMVETAKAAENAPPQQPPPDPAMAKVQGQLQLQQAKQQSDMQLAQAKLALQAHTAAHDHATGSAANDQQFALSAHTAAHAHANAVDQSANDGGLAMLKAHMDAQIAQQAEQFKAQTAIIIAHIQTLGKVEAARITANASADADAEQNEVEAGA